jgi:hypothetical protein
VIATATACAEPEPARTFGELRGIPTVLTSYATIVLAPESVELALADSICPIFSDSLEQLQSRIGEMREKRVREIFAADAMKGVEACVGEILTGRLRGACDRKTLDLDVIRRYPAVQRVGQDLLLSMEERLAFRRDSSLQTTLVAADSLRYRLDGDGRFSLVTPDSSLIGFVIVASPDGTVIARLPPLLPNDTIIVAFDSTTFSYSNDLCLRYSQRIQKTIEAEEPATSEDQIAVR